MKKTYNVLSILLTTICLSACNIFSTTTKVTFECNLEYLREITPPDGTHNCRIEILEFCNSKDSILVMSNGDIQKSKSFVTNQSGVVLNNDWYRGVLGLLYKPNSNSDQIKYTKDIVLKITFSTN